MSNLIKLLSLFLFFIMFSCSLINNSLKTSLTSQSDCVTYNLKSTPNNFDSIYYHYEGGVLEIKHYNAGFNCCPDKIIFDVTLEDNIIQVLENEKKAQCDCMCLFNIEYEIDNIDPGTYQLLIVEPYLGENDQNIDISLNLSESTSGGIAIERYNYPWVLEKY